MLPFETTGILIVALGKTIFHSIWIGLLILAMLKMVLLAIPGQQSHQRYLVYVASLLVLTVTVFATFILLYAPGSQADSDLLGFESIRMVPQIFASDTSAGSAWEPNLLFMFCSYFYFAGMVFMMLRYMFSYRYIRNLRNSGQKISGRWFESFKRISNSLGIKREISLLQSDQVTGPLLIGILKPAVIVPLGMFTHLSVSQVESILTHELYHLKRLDGLVNIMQLFLEGLLFYNPAVWYISNRIRREREYCCDDAVLKTSNDPVNYAKALVQLAEQEHYTRLAPGAGGSSKSHFMTRIERIINNSKMKKNMQERVMSLLLFAGAIMIVVIVSGFSSGFSILVPVERNPEILVQADAPGPVVSIAPMQDTIRDAKKQEQIKEEIEAARMEAMEAIEEIDWEQIKEDMKAARIEAMEEIDWEQIKEDMKAARIEAMEEIDWDQIDVEMDSAIQEMDMDFDMDLEMDFDFDMEALRVDMEEARLEMENIDWEEMKEEMKSSMAEMQIDMEEMKREIEESIKDIDWDEIRKDMQEVRHELDSLFIE